MRGDVLLHFSGLFPSLYNGDKRLRSLRSASAPRSHHSVSSVGEEEAKKHEGHHHHIPDLEICRDTEVVIRSEAKEHPLFLQVAKTHAKASSSIK